MVEKRDVLDEELPVEAENEARGVAQSMRYSCTSVEGSKARFAV